MLKLSILDGLVVKRLPFNTKESIFKINYGGSDQLITEDHVVIPDSDFERCCTWKFALKLECFKEVWAWFIKLILVTLVKDFTVAFDDKIWIRETTIVS